MSDLQDYLHVCSSLSLHCSLKGHEQVKCKFYNELGRILVKDFASVLQLDEVSEEAEDRGFSSYSHRDTGKVSFFLRYSVQNKIPGTINRVLTQPWKVWEAFSHSVQVWEKMRDHEKNLLFFFQNNFGILFSKGFKSEIL